MLNKFSKLTQLEDDRAGKQAPVLWCQLFLITHRLKFDHAQTHTHNHFLTTMKLKNNAWCPRLCKCINLPGQHTNERRGPKHYNLFQQIKLLLEYFLISIYKLYSEVIKFISEIRFHCSVITWLRFHLFFLFITKDWVTSTYLRHNKAFQL